MTMTSIDFRTVQVLRFRGSRRAFPDNPPATPASAALTTHAITLFLVVLIPIASAAISSLRIANSARPKVDKAMFRVMGRS